MPAILISVSIYYAQYLSSNNYFLFLITALSSFATFNPVNRIVTTIAYQLAVKNNYNQYKIREYFNTSEVQVKGSNSFIEDIESKFLNERSNSYMVNIESKFNFLHNIILVIKKIGYQFFRHVTYLAFTSFLLFLQFMAVNIKFLICAWILFLISIIAKEILFLYFVLKKNYIEKKFITLLKCSDNFKKI